MSTAIDTFPAKFLGIHEGTEFLGREIDAAERAGFETFFRPLREGAPEDVMGPDFRRGRRLAYAASFAQGALISSKYMGAEIANPYPQFSSAWEAWADGYNAEGHKALTID